MDWENFQRESTVLLSLGVELLPFSRCLRSKGSRTILWPGFQATPSLPAIWRITGCLAQAPEPDSGSLHLSYRVSISAHHRWGEPHSPFPAACNPPVCRDWSAYPKPSLVERWHGHGNLRGQPSGTVREPGLAVEVPETLSSLYKGGKTEPSQRVHFE